MAEFPGGLAGCVRRTVGKVSNELYYSCVCVYMRPLGKDSKLTLFPGSDQQQQLLWFEAVIRYVVDVLKPALDRPE